MDSTLATSTTFLPFHKPTSNSLLPSNPLCLPSKTLQKPFSNLSISCNSTINASNYPNNENPVAKTFKNVAGTAVLTVAATLMSVKFTEMPAKAEPLTPTVEESTAKDEKSDEINENIDGSEVETPSSKLIDSNAEVVENLRSLLHQKLENGEDEEALKILGKLVEAQPNEIEWKFMLARLLNEMGKTQESRNVFEDILSINPLSFEALFENALLMDQCGEGEAVISRLERALEIAIDESKAKEARDVKLIMAQIQFFQRNVDEALSSYDELAKEDPKDFRPYFCKGMIYSFLDRNAEAKEQFDKYKELSPEKFEVDGCLRSLLSRMKLFERVLRIEICDDYGLIDALKDLMISFSNNK